MKITLRLMLLSVAMLLFGNHARAGSIDEQHAKAKALSFLKSMRVSQSGTSLVRAVTPTQLSSTPTGEPALYVFNVGTNGGFVIVSGDDRTREILGFTDSGTFDAQKAPLALREMLAIYSAQISRLGATDEQPDSMVLASRAMSSTNVTLSDVTPLLTTAWNQGYPYNAYCPTLNGQTALTGCVATAMAQIAYYHKYPTEKAPSLSAYISETNKINVTAWGATTFDWDNLLDNYDGSYTETQKNAVATLMRYCGQAAHMDYGFTSAAYNGDALIAFTEKLGYNPYTAYKFASDYSVAGWEEVIYKEISEQRPVFYLARNGDSGSASGHAFIVDGYKSDGNYFHVNWGWGGNYDGYFNLFALDTDAPESAPTAKGWHYRMSALIGLSPETMNRPNLTKDATGSYLINNADDWIELSENLDLYNGGTFKLTDDISISTMVGSDALAFSGTFDGQGNVINIDLRGSIQGVSPFSKVEAGSTFKNIKTTGTVTSSAYHSSGLIGMVNNNTGLPLNIYNCEVAVDVNGKSYCGGFVGHAGSSQVVFSDCIFSGDLYGCYQKGCFVGWKEKECRPVYYNCLAISDYFAVLSHSGNGGSASDATLNNCYCHFSSGSGTTQATAVSSTALEDGSIARALQRGTRDWTTGLVWGQKLGTDDFPMLTSDASKGVYAVTFTWNDDVLESFLSNSPLGDRMPSGEDLGLSNATFTCNGASFNGETVFSDDANIIITGSMAYTMTLEAPKNGTISINDNTCRPGKLRKITTVPAEGYVVSAVKVTDSDDNLLPVTKVSNADNEYVFSFPKSSVTVTAEFAPGEAEAVRFINNGMTLPASTLEADHHWTADTWTIWGGKYNSNNKDIIVGTPPVDATKQQWYEEGYALTNSEDDLQPNGKQIVWENHAASFKYKGDYSYFHECGANRTDLLGDFYIRRIFTFNAENVPSKLYLSCACKDSPAELYINGTLVCKNFTYSWDWPGSITLTPEQIALIHTDGTPNVMALHVSHNYGDYYLDCGLFDPTAVNYEVTSENTVRVRRNPKISGNIVIPETMTHNGVEYTVTELAPSIFERCFEVTSVELPRTITSVDENAFKELSYNLEYVKSYIPIFREKELIAAPVEAVEFVIPLGYNKIRSNAFKFTESLTTLTLPRTLTSIGEKAFVGCKALTDIYAYCMSVPYRSSNVFEGVNKSAVTVHVYESALSSFKESWGEEFTYVTMPDPQPLTLTVNVETKGTLKEQITIASEEKGGTYYDVVDLTVTGNINQEDLDFIRSTIGGSSTNGRGLNRLDLGDVIVEGNRFNYSTLSDCVFETLILPKTLVNMFSSDILSNCSKIKAIDIPNSVTKIYDRFLYNCNSLETVTGGDGITEISQYTMYLFDICPNLKSPVILNTFFCRLPVSTEGAYEVPENVTVLAYGSMWNVKGLTSLTLPESVTAIYCDVVAKDENLKDIYFYAVDLPETDTYAFRDFDKTSCTLHVYEEMVDVFKNNSVWKDFNITGDLGAMPVQTPMNEADYADLCAIYNTLGGSKWKNKWVTEKNVQASSRWSGVTFDEEGYVTDINLRENGLSGDISSLTFTGLTRLASLNLSKNALTGDIMPLKRTLSSRCNLNVLEQDFGFIGGHTLYGLLDYEGLPSIAYYNNGSLAYGLIGVGGQCKFAHEGTDDNPQWECKIELSGNAVSNIPFRWSSPTTLECTYPHRFTFTYKYNMGDANMDDAINVLDLQSTLNYSNNQGCGLFNFYAADTYGPDDDINVQDIVATVNILLAQESNQEAAARAFFGAATETEACVSVEDGKLVLYTTKPVAALDLHIAGIEPQHLTWNTEDMGFATATAAQQNGTHAIIYSLMPREIEAGRTVLATFDEETAPRISSATLSDSKARAITVGNYVPTGISDIYDTTATRWSVTDVSGSTLITGSNATEADILKRVREKRLNGVLIINMDGAKRKIVIK